MAKKNFNIFLWLLDYWNKYSIFLSYCYIPAQNLSTTSFFSSNFKIESENAIVEIYQSSM